MASPSLSTWVPNLAAVQTLAGGVPISHSFALVEVRDNAAFGVDAIVNAALAATEAQDVAAFVGGPAVILALATTEAADIAAFLATSGVNVSLAATESADVAAFAADAAIGVALAATEARDHVAFAGGPAIAAALGAGEQRDQAAFRALPAIGATMAVLEPGDSARVLVKTPPPVDLVWPWCPLPGVTRQTQVAVDELTYGDGYNHRSTRGLNPARPAWTMQFPFVDLGELTAYTDFLEANAARGFWLQLPDDKTVVFVTSDEWSATIIDRTGSEFAGTLQATFTEAFNIQPIALAGVGDLRINHAH